MGIGPGYRGRYSGSSCRCDSNYSSTPSPSSCPEKDNSKNKLKEILDGWNNVYKYFAEKIKDDSPNELFGLGSGATIVDPTLFRIKRYYELYDYLLLHVVYPNCKNFEGNKYILYKGVTLNDILTLNVLDPHFCISTEHPTPLARFEPTPHGWNTAITLVKHLVDLNL